MRIIKPEITDKITIFGNNLQFHISNPIWYYNNNIIVSQIE